METDTRIAGVTVTDTLPLTEFKAAVMVSVPGPVAVANPIVGAESLMLATVAEDEVQKADDVTSCVVPSVKVPAAVNWSVVPRGMDGAAAETAIETTAAVVTVRMADPPVDPDVAAMVLVPLVRPRARPLALMVATPVFDELQVEELVRSFVVPSVKVPVAVN